MSPSLDDWWLEMHYSSILRKSMRPYRSQSPYHKFEMDVRPNTSSYRVGDTTQVDLPHQIVYRGDSCNAEGYLNEALTARKSYINIKAVRDSKFVLIEHIRGLLKPYWKQGNLSRDVYKIIMKKSVDKIIEGIEVSKFPKTKCDHQKYLSASKRKIIDHDRSAIDPLTVPEENSGRITTLLVGRKRVEGLQKETEKGNMVVAEVDESSSNKIKAVNAFKFVLIEHIRDVLKPYWKQGNLSRDAYKIILKKSVDKIIESIEASKFPKTKSDHQKHLSASKSKIFELIQVRVDHVLRYHNEHIRDVLKPYWKQGNLSRDAYKIILKKSVDKIIESIKASKFPKTKSDYQKHLPASKSKIFELIQV